MKVNGSHVPVAASASSIGYSLTPTEHARSRPPSSRAAHDRRRRTARGAGILVTGTEVLTGIISDRNGPWLSERLREIGVDAAMIQIVGDRPEDLLTALRFMARRRGWR